MYAGKPSSAQNASGVSGVLIRSLNGRYFFPIYDNNHESTDYELRHDDLNITIDSNCLASFYTCDNNHSPDHSPEVPGLTKADD